jgi:hypothetical protein
MSRRKSRPQGEARPSEPTPPPPGRGLRRLGTIALVALPIIVAALLLRPRGDKPHPRGAREATIADMAMLDSLRVADARRDWVTSLFWAERLGARRPRDHGVLLARGTAWSNYALDQRPGRVLARPALRTSLERTECMGRALTLVDSAAMAARVPGKWVDAMMRLGHIEETLGLPGDALIAYEAVRQQLRDESAPALRAYWLRALFYDPVNPDTSEWDRRMRRLGRR